MTTSSLALEVSVSHDTLSTAIEDRRADAVALFAPLPSEQRISLAGDAWMVGLRAVMNAYRLAEESRLQDIGRTILTEVDVELAGYVERQQDSFLALLKRYFDPGDGQLVTRIDGFLKDGGDLTRAMEKFLSPNTGMLAMTLSSSLGENSQLLKRLSPTDSNGVISLIEARVRQALEQNRADVANALDPLKPDGAVARFLKSLRTDLEKAEGERTKQLTLVTKQLDANDEKSLLSRLVRETEAAGKKMLEAMNPDAAGSALAILRTSLTSIFQQHAKSQTEVMAAFEERQKSLDKEIRDVVARLEGGKRADATSPRGGRLFEDQVCLFTHSALNGVPVFVDDTGATVGARSNCKVGDQVVRFSSESVYAGSAIVIEAKREAGYSLSKALLELEVARSNRLAQAGVFVLARSHALPGFPAFARCGNDVVVIWDDNDQATDAYLQAAVLLALGLASRQTRGSDQGNIAALADIEQKVERELKRHERMRDLVDSIQKKSEDLADELRKGTKGINALLKDTKETLKALNVEMESVEEERAEPFTLPAADLGAARAALA